MSVGDGFCVPVLVDLLVYVYQVSRGEEGGDAGRQSGHPVYQREGGRAPGCHAGTLPSL